MEENLSRFSFLGMVNGPLSCEYSYDIDTRTISCQTTSRLYALCYKVWPHHTMNRDYKIHLENGDSFFDFISREKCKASLPHKNELPFEFQCGFVGYFGYEMFAESIPVGIEYDRVCTAITHTVPLKVVKGISCADACFLFVDRCVVFDHKDDLVYLLCLSDDALAASAWLHEMKSLLRKVSQCSCFYGKLPGLLFTVATLLRKWQAQTKFRSSCECITAAIP